MRRIAVINQVGGVGKTTITASLGHALALAGQRVTVMDLDPSGRLAHGLGIFRAPSKGIDRVMMNGTTLGSVKMAVRDLLGLIPAGVKLLEMEHLQKDGTTRMQLLKQAVDGQLSDQAFVLFDVPSSSALLMANAIFAADEVLIPVTAEPSSLNGALKTLLLIKRFEPYLARPPCARIVLNRFLPRSKDAKAMQEKLQKHFSDLCLETKIRQGAAFEACAGIGRTIFEFKPASHSAKEFHALAKELLALNDTK
ncbi:MAG: ParA family protein [Candidatus Thiodiazotropha sp. (ex Notomyrtea botanica)]|nr:ParA family protein [Candidatus Thiodiazotropha sp. (ex Notomyrtea botanica)]